jgi:hypothetical protein
MREKIMPFSPMPFPPPRRVSGTLGNTKRQKVGRINIRKNPRTARNLPICQGKPLPRVVAIQFGRQSDSNAKRKIGAIPLVSLTPQQPRNSKARVRVAASLLKRACAHSENNKSTAKPNVRKSHHTQVFEFEARPLRTSRQVFEARLLRTSRKSPPPSRTEKGESGKQKLERTGASEIIQRGKLKPGAVGKEGGRGRTTNK